MLVKIINQDSDARWINPEAVLLVLDRFDEATRRNCTIVVLEEVGELWTDELLDSVVARVNQELR